MKNALKIVSFVLGVVLIGLVVFYFLSGGKDGDKKVAATDTDTPASTQLIMGTNAYFPPYEFYDDNGKIVGIDAEIAALIADKLGMKLVIEDMEFDSIITAVTTGKIDMGMAGMTVTPDRQQSVDFSTSYATGKQVIIVKDGSAIADYDGLKDKKIGVQLSTTGDIYISGDIGDGKLGAAKVEQYASGFEAVNSLVQGKLDAVVIDSEPAKVFVANNPGIKILPTEYIVEDYAIATAKDSELTAKINTALEQLIADGSVQAVIDKYIKA